MNLFRTKSIEQSMSDADEPGRKLKRTLSTWDLMIMGVAVAVGAGIFSVGAKAAGQLRRPRPSPSPSCSPRSPARSPSCVTPSSPRRSPSRAPPTPITYATLGELLAWIIGWDLILEMLTAGAVIAKYWGIYLSNVFELWNWDVPPTIPLVGLDVELGRRSSSWRSSPPCSCSAPSSAPRRRGVHDHQGRDRALRHRGRRLLHQPGQLHPVHPAGRADAHRGGRRLDAVAVLAS